MNVTAFEDASGCGLAGRKNLDLHLIYKEKTNVIHDAGSPRVRQVTAVWNFFPIRQKSVRNNA